MKQRRKYRINWFRLVMVGLIAYFAYLSFGQQAQLNMINQEAEKAQTQLEEAKQLNIKLNEERSRLHDRAYVEKIAREELGLVKPGEVPYVPAKEEQ
ncbi:putative membrane protein [Propionispora sp. 2/2-37]|uniref:FtsB family cell division protein n=1 Tax=Propionispora sp. 2/2-37 TaxID=1677858 RepID=UPI0006BB62B3|nr:septum formation initiator family protein [Propionispora sp. 2/2-37]CUH96461.1 putative membrane protein [Propionispora sp. 2/2-37]